MSGMEVVKMYVGKNIYPHIPQKFLPINTHK